jgi:hypothetical protein
LLGALTLAQASVAGNPAARKEGCRPGNPVPTASTGREQPGTPDSVARMVGSWSLRSHKHSHVFPRFAGGDDPDDNETSDDPNDDDDAWDDLNADDDTDLPIIVWPRERVLSLITHESAPITWVAPSSSPFLTLERLRC